MKRQHLPRNTRLRGKTYYGYIRIPQDVKAILGKSVIERSLKTHDPLEAKGRAAALSDVNLIQVQAGMAWWCEYYKDQQSPEDQRLYSTAHDRAKKDKVGLWEDPLAINPYKWRKRYN